MTPSKSEKFKDQDELIESARDRKLRKKRHPRGRGFAVRKKSELKIGRSKESEVKEAEGKIKGQMDRFPDFDTSEGRKQAERYISWVSNSLSQKHPEPSEEDIEYKTATASVKAGGQKRQKTKNSVRATHLPTKIRVRNEEQRSLEENKKAAYKNLISRLADHLSLWQILSRGNPKRYSVEAIKRRGIDLLDELRSK
ncbi:MAG: peptide chain release factor-like protein [Patescibacteria group bacterium]